MGAIDRYFPRLSEAQRRWVRFGLIVAGVIGLYWLVNRLSGVLTPIVVALAIAYVLNPLVAWQQKRYGASRMRSTVSIFALGFLVLSILLVLLVTAGVAQIAQLAANIDVYRDELNDWLAAHFPSLLDSEQNAARFKAYFSQYGQAAVGAIALYFGAIFSNVVWWATTLVLVPMYTFFFLLNFEKMIAVIRDHLPTAYRPFIVEVATVTDRSMSDFFRGRLIVSLVVGVLTALGWLIIGVPYSIPLGLAAGVLNLVPVVSIMVLPPAMFVTYVSAARAGHDWVWPLILLLAVYSLVQALDNFILSPYICGQTSGLHPITTVVALLIGAELGGVLGMLLSIPLAGTLKHLSVVYVMPEIRRLAGRPPSTAPPDSSSSAPPPSGGAVAEPPPAV